MRDDERGHLRIIHSNSEPVAGDAGLCHLKDCIADSVPVSNADLTIRQTVNGEILSKLSVLEIVPAEFALPIPIRVELIDHHGTLFAPMALEIPLAIAIQIQSASNDTVRYGLLPNCGADQLALPFEFTRKADIY
jgi:hypothetical protein